MLIAIDYDRTWTAEPMLWGRFCEMTEAYGHMRIDVIIVTNREETDPVKHVGDLPVIYAGRQLKEDAAIAAGYKVDIWIDDTPGTIQRCRYLDDAEDL